MFKVYAIIIIIAVLGGIGAGAKYYYDTTQNTITILRENNAELKHAAETAEASVNTLKNSMAQMASLNMKLQSDLQKAEAYSDELRGKLSRLDLVQDALKDPTKLEGKMNGATAKLWRKFMEDTGNVNDYPVPQWLQQSPPRDENSNSDQSGTSPDSDSSQTEATTTN
jgi:prefoldin subunit 5